MLAHYTFTGHKMINKNIDAITGEETFVEFTQQELDHIAESAIALAAKIEAEATKAAEKAALLAKLGITDDEAKLLLS
jgi:hypothetical protein